MARSRHTDMSTNALADHIACQDVMLVDDASLDLDKLRAWAGDKLSG